LSELLYHEGTLSHFCRPEEEQKIIVIETVHRLVVYIDEATNGDDFFASNFELNGANIGTNPTK